MNNTPNDREQTIKQSIEFLRANRPLLAEDLCRNFLSQNPGSTAHLRLLGHALMNQQRLDEAKEQLNLALDLDPESPQLHEDIGSILSLQDNFNEAIPYLKKAIQLEPSLPLAHKKLAQALASVGKDEEAKESIEEHINLDEHRANVLKGIELAKTGKPDEAKKIFIATLNQDPENINAMLQLAIIYWHSEDKLNDAQSLLRRATQLSPTFTNAWFTLGNLLIAKRNYPEAINIFIKTTELAPKQADYWDALGNAYSRSMQPAESAKAYKNALAINPDNPYSLSGYAYELKTLGDQEGALTAYRDALKIKPDYGEIYWSMANLKIFKFEDAEVNTMIDQLEHSDLSEKSRIHMLFALGKAMEDKKEYDSAWHYYDTGNNEQRMTVDHDPVELEEKYKNIQFTFNKDEIDKRDGCGHDAKDPIFIVGLPRSGSTLLEQILSSHSQVEGTSELGYIGKITDSIGRYHTQKFAYPTAIPELRAKDFVGYGKQYIEDSRRHRITDKPFFTDKLPNNFPHIGFIHLILPNAKIINARRHPFDSCLGGYKQLFGHGQNFTYDMFELAQYYEQYDNMMKHWHQVLPGKVLDVHYEETVTDTEAQVRRILDHCGLPFEESCLRFYENERAVKTASSEQVRQPIYTGALGKWRCYDKHLGLLKEELEHIVAELPEASKNAGL